MVVVNDRILAPTIGTKHVVDQRLFVEFVISGTHPTDASPKFRLEFLGGSKPLFPTGMGTLD